MQEEAGQGSSSPLLLNVDSEHIMSAIANKINGSIAANTGQIESNQVTMMEMRRREIKELRISLLSDVDTKIKAMQEDVIAKILGFLDHSELIVEGLSTSKNIPANVGVTVGYNAGPVNGGWTMPPPSEVISPYQAVSDIISSILEAITGVHVQSNWTPIQRLETTVHKQIFIYFIHLCHIIDRLS